MKIFLIVIIIIFIIGRLCRGAANNLHTFWANMTDDKLIALIGEGFDVNTKNNQGMTPLMFAASLNPNPDIINILTSYGANINEQNVLGMTALHCCVRYNSNPDVAEMLLIKGATTEAVDRNGWTPLISCCVSDSNFKFVEILLKYGADINFREYLEGKTALDIISEKDTPNAEVIKKMLSKKRRVK